MCEFISGKINPETLEITTAKSLSNHSDIPGNDLEWEWVNEESLHVRTVDGDVVSAKLKKYIRQVYGTWQKCADTLVVEYLKKGMMPGYFYKHSKFEHCAKSYKGEMSYEMEAAGMKHWEGEPPEDVKIDVVVGLHVIVGVVAFDGVHPIGCFFDRHTV